MGDNISKESWLTKISFKNLDISQDGASLEGYEVGVEEANWTNWLGRLLNREEALEVEEKINTRHSIVAVLKNMWVDESLRGNGVGTQLLEDFLGSTAATAIFLEADMGESSNLFSLEDWYSGFGFRTIAHSGQNPIMLLERT